MPALLFCYVRNRMRVRVEFEDDSAFTAEELKKGYEQSFGKNSKVEVLPHNESSEAAIYFGIQNLITLDLLDIYYEFYPHLYPPKLEELKKITLIKLQKILDQVCIDIENRVKE